MTVLYKLASGQLSKQSHYDFGLRALKAVLVMAGELKRGSPDLNEASFTLKAPEDDVTRDDSQRRVLSQQSVATLLRHCFE